MRYLRRGINTYGYVANEIETECIAWNTTHGVVSSSFIRGTIPMYWEQDGFTIPSSVTIHLLRDPQFQDTEKHFLQLYRRYGGRVHCVSLIRKKERKLRESKLGRLFTYIVTVINRRLCKQFNHSKDIYTDLTTILHNDHTAGNGGMDSSKDGCQTKDGEEEGASYSNGGENDTPYLYIGAYFGTCVALYTYDIHARFTEDKNIFKELQPLVSALLDDVGVTSVDINTQHTTQQHGVLRLNCMDCLDRTNIVAYLVTMLNLPRQMYT
uniref:Polyphosphoinositide phosphatase n=1 Tax=Lygus hesperus TaxID=30085 RepID=A0A0A9YZ74_LYGHE